MNAPINYFKIIVLISFDILLFALKSLRNVMMFNTSCAWFILKYLLYTLKDHLDLLSESKQTSTTYIRNQDISNDFVPFYGLTP